jgi:hypothetical protein
MNTRGHERLNRLHPEPAIAGGTQVTHFKLQIRGSWEKIKVKAPGGPSSRAGACAFIWSGNVSA